MVKRTDFNTNVIETEGEIPNNTGLATNSELTAVENKILDVSSLVKKQTVTEKYQILKKKTINHNHDKYITTSELKTLAADVFNARLAAQTELIRKPDFDFNLKGISDRITKNNKLACRK